MCKIPDYLIITKEVMQDSRLSSDEKLLLSLITTLYKVNKSCFASNAYFAEAFNVNERSIRRWLTHLFELNLVASEKIYNGKIVEKRLLIPATIPLDTNGHQLTNLSFTNGQTCPKESDKSVLDNTTSLKELSNTNYREVTESCLKDFKDLKDLTIKWLEDTLMNHSSYKINPKHYSNQLEFLKQLAVEDLDKATFLIKEAIRNKMFNLQTCFNSHVKDKPIRTYDPKHPSEQQIATKEEPSKKEQPTYIGQSEEEEREEYFKAFGHYPED